MQTEGTGKKYATNDHKKKGQKRKGNIKYQRGASQIRTYEPEGAVY